MSRINRGEIIYNAALKLGRSRLEEIREKVDALPCEIISAEDNLVDEAAELKTLYPISYADCFVAVLAQWHNASVMTGDPDFFKLQSAGLLRVEWMGK
jgi:predicted nucleic acid-binding protein